MAYRYPRWKRWLSRGHLIALVLGILLAGVYFSLYREKSSLSSSLRSEEQALRRENTEMEKEIADLRDRRDRLARGDEEEILERARKLGLGRKNEIITRDRSEMKDSSAADEEKEEARSGEPASWWEGLLKRLFFWRTPKSHG